MTGPEAAKADRSRREAADWFVRLQSERATGEDWSAFERWLKTDPAHEADFRAVESAWIDIEPDQTASTCAAPIAVSDAQSAAVIPFPHRRSPRRGWLIPSAAAAAVTLLVAGAVLIGPGAGLAPPTRYVATAGGRDLALPGGGSVHLDRGASIDLGGGPRTIAIALLAGHARFAVRHDPERRVAVAAGDARIVDVGTTFDLSRDADGQIRLAVREGSVTLARGQGISNVLTVSAGEMAVSRGDGIGPRRVGADGRPLRRIYRDAALAAVIADLNRLYTRPVRVAAHTGARRFTGVLQIEAQDATVRRLAAFTDLDVDDTRDGLVLRKATKTAP